MTTEDRLENLRVAVRDLTIKVVEQGIDIGRLREASWKGYGSSIRFWFRRQLYLYMERFWRVPLIGDLLRRIWNWVV